MDAYGHRSYNFTAHNTQAYLASEMASNASNASFFQSKVEPVVKFKAMSHKVNIFLYGNKILRNLHLTFVLCSASQK